MLPNELSEFEQWTLTYQYNAYSRYLSVHQIRIMIKTHDSNIQKNEKTERTQSNLFFVQVHEATYERYIIYIYVVAWHKGAPDSNMYCFFI